AASGARLVDHVPPDRRERRRRAPLAVPGDGPRAVPLHAGRGGQALPRAARARLAVGLLRARREAALLLRHERDGPRARRARVHRGAPLAGYKAAAEWPPGFPAVLRERRRRRPPA